jgi:Xaa-Pro aminopeptidase
MTITSRVAEGAVPDLAALPPLDHRGRLERCRAALADHAMVQRADGPNPRPGEEPDGNGEGLDALLVTKLEHIRYLTGFTGSAALLLVQPQRVLFVTDGRYDEQSRQQLGAAGVDAEIVVTVEQRETVTAAAGGLRRVGLEAGAVTWAAQRRYAADWFPEAEMVPTEGVVEAWRERKEPAEVARVEAAAAIADAALTRCLPLLRSGPTEADFALELDTAMRRLGASGPAFETIIAAGPNSAKPHHRPSNRRIAEGDLVVVDFGATVDGYRSDMTRTLCVGEPSPSQVELHAVVGRAQAAGRDAVRAGVEAKAVDAATREVIETAGWGPRFPHGTGHGVGLEIHEAPYVGRTSAATLTESSVVTVEPGVYLEGIGGVRTEDTVVVTVSGCRTLTLFPKSLTF